MNLFKTTTLDRKMIQQWIDLDPDHKGKVDADFFIANDIETGENVAKNKVETWIYNDVKGPVFAIRVERCLRLHIQFNTDKTMTLRVAKALSHGFQWIIYKATNLGFSSIMFDSHSKSLIEFCKKRFGFVSMPEDLERRL